MPRNEEGEFELILGNRQLLSVFFIVVVLLGVFFTMGYIVGRNSSPGSDLARRAANTIVVDKQEDAAKPEPSKPLAPGQAEVTAPGATRQPPAPEPAKQAEDRKPEPAKTEAAKAPPKSEPKPEAAKAAAPAAPAGEPAHGTTWLQVVATTAKADAELMVNVLRKKGFSATIAPSNNDTLFRVLVGPLPDSASVSKTRAELTEAGFKGAFVKKY